MREALSRFACVKDLHFHSEPLAGLAAAMKTGGAVALSGTGSNAFLVREGQVLSAVGGWGPLLGDEGSGYEIGLNALKAAIYSHDGRRPKSMLYSRGYGRKTRSLNLLSVAPLSVACGMDCPWRRYGKTSGVDFTIFCIHEKGFSL